MGARERTGTIGVGVAGGNGPLRWVAEDAKRLEIGRSGLLPEQSVASNADSLGFDHNVLPSGRATQLCPYKLSSSRLQM